MTYEVSCIMKFENQQTRDDVFEYLRSKQTNSVQNQPSYIERHTCGHDENKACTDEEHISWGGEDYV